MNGRDTMTGAVMWTVWVGGSEVNNYYRTKEEAQELAEVWKNDGYDDVRIRKVKKAAR